MLTLIIGVALGTLLGGLLGSLFVMFMLTNKRVLKIYTKKVTRLSMEVAEEIFKEQTEEA